MSTSKIPISVDIRVRVSEMGSLKGIVTDAQQLQKETGAIISITAQMGRTSQLSRTAIRGLAFDLRLVSSGLSVLRTEFGGFNPVVDATVSGMRILSGALSAGLGTINFLTTSTRLINQEFGSFGGLIKAADDAMKTLTLGTAAFGVVVGAVIGIAAGTAWGEWKFGISRMKEEIRDLNVELEEYQYRMLNLQDVQSGFREDQAMLNMIIQSTEYAIEQQGYATEFQTAQLEAAQSQTRRLGVDQATLSYEMAKVQRETTLASNQIARYRIEIGAIERGVREAALTGWGLFGGGGFVPQGRALGVPGAQLTGEIGKTGMLWAEAGEVIMQKEQMATMMQNQGGNIQVSISFPGAVISSGPEMEAAIIRGGRRAGDELRQQMEMDRYRIKRR